MNRMDVLTVERSIWIAAPRERVWRAVTDPEQIGQWWPPNEWKIPVLEVGGTVRFGAEPDVYEATIDVLEPLRQFTLRWHSNERFPITTMVTTLALEEENGGTRLTVNESGFESLPDDVREKRFEQTAEGYTLVLADLKRLLEQEKG